MINVEDVMFSGLKETLLRANFKAVGVIKIPGYQDEDGIFLMIGFDTQGSQL